MEQLLTLTSNITLFILVIIGIIVALIIYIKWLFIRSAVESGTIRAIEKILHDYTDLIEDVYDEDLDKNN